MSTTVGEDLPRVMTYVRDEVMPAYREIGPAGNLALACMRHDLDIAARAMAEQDMGRMMAAYKSLKEYSL